jgi:hypothetical protein
MPAIPTLAVSSSDMLTITSPLSSAAIAADSNRPGTAGLSLFQTGGKIMETKAIHDAIKAGITVYWASHNYRIIARNDDLFIYCDANGMIKGLQDSEAVQCFTLADRPRPEPVKARRVARWTVCRAYDDDESLQAGEPNGSEVVGEFRSVSEAIRHCEPLTMESDSSGWEVIDGGRWFRVIYSEYRTREYVTVTLHPPQSVTAASLRRLARILGAA